MKYDYYNPSTVAKLIMFDGEMAAAGGDATFDSLPNILAVFICVAWSIISLLLLLLALSGREFLL